MALQDVNLILDVISKFILIIGVPIGIFKYFKTVRREQLDREYGTYNALDQEYADFLKLAFENPHLDIFDIPDSNPELLSGIDRKKEKIAFMLLVSLFERAYLMYKDQPSELRRRQWRGWDSYIDRYCRRGNFRAVFSEIIEEFDEEYVNMLKEKMKRYTT